MSETPRPPHTTLAAGMVIGGSVLVVLTVAERLSAIHSLETREAVSEFLATSPGTGLDVPAALLLLRTALMVVAGCATAAVVLGVHVLRRNRAARLGLSVLSVPLFLGGLATGGFLTSLVAASALLLWIGPSRAWLDRTPLPADPPHDRRRAVEEPRPSWPPPPPYAGGADVRPGQPGPYPGELGRIPADPYPPPPERRPAALTAACLVTWASAGLVALLLGATLGLVASDPGLVWEELQQQDPDLVAESGLARGDLLRVTYLMLGLATLWALLAAVLAVLAYRRSPGGRVALVVCAAAAGLLCVLGSLGAAPMLLPAMACLTTVLLLSRADVVAWFAAARRRP